MHFLCMDVTPGFLAKEESKAIPFMGLICTTIGIVFMKRDCSKERRANLIAMIGERQLLAEEGKFPPIHIYPEGSTTNGTAILKFKKGAFASLRAVKPYVTTYRSVRANPCFGTPISEFFYALLAMNCIAIHGLMRELPVFEPNEYFWTNHWQEGKEEKWEAFARVVREIIAANSSDPNSPPDPITGFGSEPQKLCEITMEDKLIYKQELVDALKSQKKDKKDL